jgi:hypothetical protein
MSKPNRFDAELDQYRNLMKAPGKFADGFNWKTIVGAFFLGVVMMPASMYLSLFAGAGVGGAAQWVTIIIFAEIARRSLKELRMQEIYILYYMAGLAIASPFSGLLWNQYFVQSEYVKAMGIAQDIPAWFAPQEAVIREAGRTFFTKAWLAPILLSSLGLVVGMIDNYGLGYVLYRITSDVEELPFPMAPVAASGIVALTESKAERESWRWRCFSIGGMLGLLFGTIYIAVPAVTGVILTKPLQFIPIPFIDLTPQLTQFFPATAFNVTLDIGAFIAGTVIPFWAVIGSALATVLNLLINPFLYRHGIITSWTPQMDFIDTSFSTSLDFYLSFGIGITIAVSLISMGKVFKPLFGVLGRKLRGNSGSEDLAAAAVRKAAWKRLFTNNVERGDFSIFIALGIYLVNSALWIGLSCWLVPGFPWPFFAFYALVYTPMISYAAAKLEGLMGMSVSIPLIREATYILSGYRGVAIWFAPAPLPNYGTAAGSYRVMELTGTKIRSVMKTQMVVIPIIIVSSLIFSEILWRMAPIPSDSYPYAQKMWELNAKNMSLTYSSTMEGGSLFMESWRWPFFFTGMGFGLIAYLLLSAFGLPTLLIFGMVQGLGAAVGGGFLLSLMGALVGRFYLRRRFGSDWLKYAPVILAGYACGMGLIAMLSVSFTILMKMMSPLLF